MYTSETSILCAATFQMFRSVTKYSPRYFALDVVKLADFVCDDNAFYGLFVKSIAVKYALQQLLVRVTSGCDGISRCNVWSGRHLQTRSSRLANRLMGVRYRV